MTFNLNELEEIYPEHLCLELSTEEKNEIWKIISQQTYSNYATCWQGFINCLCRNSFVNWLQCDHELNEELNILPQNQDFNIWEFVNGSSITIDETKIVFIPTEKSNPIEFEIPKEWVDIPSWEAHYYLAVQLNVEQSWMHIWGYVTHQQIIDKGSYNPINKTYCLDREELIPDLSIMWIAREFCPQKLGLGKSVLNISNVYAETLIKKLSQKDIVSPRFYANFEEWATLISTADWRNQLYQRRWENCNKHQEKLSIPRIINLSQWLENKFTEGWEHVDTLLHFQKKTIASQFRSDIALNKYRVKGAKLIDLGMQIGKQSVILLVGISPEIDDKISIRVQLYPADEESYLPSSIRLGLLSHSGMLLQEVISRSHDSYVQLKRFKFPLGKSFSIQMVLGDINIKEDFMLDQLLGKIS